LQQFGANFPEIKKLCPDEANLPRTAVLPYMPFSIDINVRASNLADIQYQIFETTKVESYTPGKDTDWVDVTSDEAKKRQSITHGFINVPVYEPGMKQENLQVVAKFTKPEQGATHRVICADMPKYASTLSPGTFKRLSITQEVVIRDKSGKHKDVTVKVHFMIGLNKEGKLDYELPHEVP
jgi:hypothetical protein